MPNKKITVLGLWHLGSVYTASLSKMGHTVLGFDTDKKVIENLKRGVAPIFEPELEETLNAYRDRLTFSTKENDIRGSDYVFIAHDMEVDEDDVPQTGVTKKTFALIAKYAPRATIVISSQVLVGTARELVNILKKKGIKNPKVICFPENLRLGTAFESFLRPDRIILGADDQSIVDQFKKDFNFPCPVIFMGLESAEMVKHTLNSYLATCVSFSSEITDLCEKTGANMQDVVNALKADRRVSQYAPINPGLGFAGGTLGRDVQSLQKISKKYKYTPKLLPAVYSINQDRVPMLMQKIQSLQKNLKGKNIGILGLTYKPNTNTLRRSMSLGLATLLDKKGSILRAFDPVIKEKIDGFNFIEICESSDQFFKGLDMVVLMTDWKQFLDIPAEKVAKLMKNKTVVDTKNFLDSKTYKKSGFIYVGMGIN